MKDGIKKLSEQNVRSRQFLTDTELSRELNISKKTLANYRAKGEFGYYALPGKILYDAAEIDEFLQSHYLPPFRWTTVAPTNNLAGRGDNF